MIAKQSLTTEWLDKVSAQNNNADKILIEKVIRALLLLEGLASSELKFIFKGGTALMLLLKSTKRLSIDIDIIISDKQELESLFKKFIVDKGFIRFELQHRHANSDIEKAHYKFYYGPVHNTGAAEDYVLLDILFEEPHYINIIDQPIDSSFIIQDGEPLTVKVPGYEDILGDKLTAFAPYTSGIPYEKNGVSRAMEIIKQLYDIGSLLPYAEDTAVVSQTFRIFARTELGYRHCEPDIAPVLEDIYQTSLHICTRGNAGKGDLEHLMMGIKQVNNFIFSENYQIDKAIIDASKAAYLSKVIEHGKTSFEKYKEIGQIHDMIIKQPFNTKLNKLKKSNAEAFFYWYMIYKIEMEKQPKS